MEGSWGHQPCQGSLKINKKKLILFFKNFQTKIINLVLKSLSNRKVNRS